MMLNGGWLDDAQILSRTTVSLMTSDHLGPQMARTMQPGDTASAHRATPSASASGSGRNRASPPFRGRRASTRGVVTAGTYFWIDPKEELVGIMMTQAPGPSRQYYRREIKQLVYQAITDRQPSAAAVR